MGGCPHSDIDPNELTLSGCKSHMFSPGFNSKGRLPTQNPAQTTVLPNQWASGFLFKRDALIK